MNDISESVNTLFSSGNMQIFWLILLVLMIVMEIITVGLTTIWLAGGALAALITTICGGPLWLQIVIFFAVTFLLLFFTRPLALKYINMKKKKTNVDATIGKEVVILEKVDNLAETGKAKLNGLEWTARAVENSVTFEEGETGIVAGIEGVKLLLEKSNEDLLDADCQPQVFQKTCD